MNNYDIYIIGGGLVGLILFKELKKLKKKVCLIESNLDELNKGYISKDSLFHSPIHEYRFRGLGGTGKEWGGGCTLFEKEDFEKWEINYDEFLNCYKKACDLLGINFEMLKNKSENNIFNKEFISEKFKPSLNLITNIKGKNVFHKIFNINEVNEFKKDIFYGSLLRFEDDMMVLNKNENEIKLCYEKCILCCGGLETTRILMNSNLNNKNIGKYYSAHLTVQKGKCILNKNIIKNPMYFNGGSKYFIYKSKDNILIRVAIPDHKDLILQGDQIPYYDSNLTLSDDKDKFNSKKIILNHQATTVDFERLIDCYNDFNNELKKNNIGYLTDIPTIENISDLTDGASHHLGTTRFGKNSLEGVVDYNFKVFDLNNVYIISTSLYPTYSHAHPTLTLIALLYRFLNIHYKE
jgi:hypothetical protein